MDSFLCKCKTGYHGNECEFGMYTQKKYKRFQLTINFLIDNDDSRWSIKPSMVNDGALIEFTSNNFPG